MMIEQSNCCGASIVENTEYNDIGMCAECLEWAEIETFEEDDNE